MLLSKLTPLWLIFEDQHHCFTQGSDMIFQFQFLGSLWANCYRIKDRTAHCQKTVQASFLLVKGLRFNLQPTKKVPNLKSEGPKFYIRRKKMHDYSCIMLVRRSRTVWTPKYFNSIEPMLNLIPKHLRLKDNSRYDLDTISLSGIILKGQTGSEVFIKTRMG